MYVIFWKLMVSEERGMGFCRERAAENDNSKVMWVNNFSYSPTGYICYLVAAYILLGIQIRVIGPFFYNLRFT